jgi:selenocysteine lyase/cysteine desulfurase
MEQTRRDFIKTCGKVAAGLSLASVAGIQSPLTSGVQKAQACIDSGSVDWELVRYNSFNLSQDYIYMNNSTMGATLVPVSDRMAEVQKIFSAGCTLDQFYREIVSVLPTLRDKMREIVNGDVYYAYPGSDPTPGKVVGNVDSVTEGISFVANGLTINKNEVILTTDHEHAGGRTMWELLRDRREAIWDTFELLHDGDTEQTWAANLVKRFQAKVAAYGSAVKVLSFPWVTTSTGHVLPAKQLCQAAKDKSITSVIDGAQAFTIIPMDLQQVPCDFLVVNGHKYLCGPIGSGFIVTRPARLASDSSFWPTVVDDQVYKAFGSTNPHSNAHRKSGISAYTNLLPLYDAMTFYQTLGSQNVYNRLLKIGQWLRSGLSMFPKSFELITPVKEGISCVMTCFRVIDRKTKKALYSEDVYATLKNQYQIQVKHSTEGYPVDPNYGKVNGAVRISPHYYNTEEEFMRLAGALCEIAGVNKRYWPDFPG